MKITEVAYANVIVDDVVNVLNPKADAVTVDVYEVAVLE